MDMPEGMNILEEHDHTSNHRLREEGMNMVDGMDMVEERSSNHWPEDESTDMVEDRPSKERPEVEGIDMEDVDMVEDMAVEVKVVEKVHEGMVLVRHSISDGAERYW
jgi:hypothetical protein